MSISPGGFGGNPLRFAPGRRNLSIQGHSRFHHDEWPSRSPPMAIGFVQPLSLILKTADGDFHPSPSQAADASSVYQGVGIRHRDDHTANARRNNDGDTGRGSFGSMAAGLERDVERAALCPAAGCLQSEAF